MKPNPNHTEPSQDQDHDIAISNGVSSAVPSADKPQNQPERRQTRSKLKKEGENVNETVKAATSSSQIAGRKPSDGADLYIIP